MWFFFSKLAPAATNGLRFVNDVHAAFARAFARVRNSRVFGFNFFSLFLIFFFFKKNIDFKICVFSAMLNWRRLATTTSLARRPSARCCAKRSTNIKHRLFEHRSSQHVVDGGFVSYCSGQRACAACCKRRRRTSRCRFVNLIYLICCFFYKNNMICFCLSLE